MKRVTIGLALDSQFISLLNANMSLRFPGWSSGENDREMDVAAVLALVCLAEARGATPEQVHSLIPPMWRPNIEAVSELRKVEEVK